MSMSERRALMRGDPNSIKPNGAGSGRPKSIDMGIISYRKFLETLANPPADNVGFDMAPEDEEQFKEFIERPDPATLGGDT